MEEKICSNQEFLLKLYRILMSEDVVQSIRDNYNELVELIPEIEAMVGFEHKHPHHHLDVWEHTLYALSLSNPDFDVRLSLLLHDIGKPYSYTEVDGIRHFHGHPSVSAKMGRDILIRLGFNTNYIDKIWYLIKYHDTPIKVIDVKLDYELTYKRYLIQKCDALAHNPEKLEKREKYLEATKILLLEH